MAPWLARNAAPFPDERKATHVAEAKKGKPGVFRWGGVLASRGRVVQAMVFVAVSVATIAFAFAQLGLVGLGEPNEGMTYAVVQLVPVAIAALLFGPLGGALLGLIAGAALLVHSHVQPLDFFEVYFITPVSSCVLLLAAGLVLGLLFAAVLRRDPSAGRRVAGIVAVCVVGAALVVFAFRGCVLYELNVNGVLAGEFANVDESFGSVWAQIAIDAVLMAAVCLAVDAVARYFGRAAAARSLRTVYRGWLMLVVLVAFMVTAAVGYVVVTFQEEQAAGELMGSEVSYLCNQIDENQERLEAFARIVGEGFVARDGSELSDEAREFVGGPLSLSRLLDGYTEEFDGMVAVVKDGTVLLTDTDQFKAGVSIDVFFGEGSEPVLSEYASTGELVQLIYSDEDMLDSSEEDRIYSLQVAYLRVGQVDDYLVLMIQPASMVFADRAGVMVWLTLSALVLLLVVFAASSRLLVRIVADPIDRVNRALERIAEGDLATRTDEESSRELASLSEGVNAMTAALEKQFAQIKEGIKRELDAAATIQESALPRAFPPYPDIPRFDIYAGMQPAREVGGDFYDFFLIGDECDAKSGKLGFVVADVSGKGVPAALFMMGAKTAIRGYMESGMELGEAFENANRKLCAGNDSAMFVTAFAGVLDYALGRIVYVNAGHNAPLVWQRGEWRQLEGKSGLPLGVFDGMPYRAFECTCAIGDELLLYTDGVTEAMDVDDSLYGLDRLRALLDGNYDLHPRELIELVRRDVARFSEGAEQADDITMLALEFGVPPEVTATIIVPADDRELPHVTEFVHTELDRRLCPVRTQRQLDIALEELFVNVAHYAYPDATPDRPGEVRISYTYSAEPPSITVEIADEGVPFDPLARPDVVAPKSIEDAQIGGLGILMAKKSVDEMRYERTDGTNVVTITKRW